jgi:mono/diheme cytochrome c family protein
MKMLVRSVLFATFAFALAPVANAQDNSVPTGDAKNGYVVFMRDGCWQCHGTTGGGSDSGPKIAPGPISYQGFLHQVRVPRGSRPAWPSSSTVQMPMYTDKILPDQEASDIYAYLKSISPGKSYKDIPLLNSRD